MRTLSAKAEDVSRRWFVVDAEGRPLGRVASKIATILRGKNKAEYTPHADTGDFVIVVNAEKVKLTGAKLDQKTYHRHLGRPGGMLEMSYRTLLDKRPALAIEHAVKGMLPKNPLGRKMAGKLKVYAGTAHPHAAQKPEPLAV
ncbi:MAG: 50S ribosomal protein L13 [Polyangiales bacterium]